MVAFAVVHLQFIQIEIWLYFKFPKVVLIICMATVMYAFVHVTASMTTIDLIIKPRTELLEPVTTLFKLAAPSISSCALSIYFSQFYLCYCLVRIRCRH